MRQPVNILKSLVTWVRGWLKAEFILLGILLIGLVVLLVNLYSIQKDSLSSLKNEIIVLGNQIKALPSETVAKDQLERRIASLQQQINAIPENSLKKQLKQQIASLKQQIDTLPETVVPKDQLALEKDRIALEKDWINTRSTVFGGLFQAGGLLFFIATTYLTLRNLKVAEENLRVSEEKQVTERFSNAVKLLGEPKSEVRIGGIYALERIAKDSVEDYWRTMEVLAGFVRERSKARWQEKEITSSGETTSQNLSSTVAPTEAIEKKRSLPPTDIQAVLRVLNRRSEYCKHDETDRLDLSSSDFSWMILVQSSFQKMDLQGATLQGADFTKADFRSADLTGANLSLADFKGANFTGVNFQKASLIASTLVGANFTGAKFQEADLSFAIFAETDPVTNNLLRSTNLTGTDFTRANLSGADLTGANFTEANLSGADLKGADLTMAVLTRANLSYADLTTTITLTREQLHQASTIDSAKLPEHLIESPPVEPEPPL